MGLNARIMLHLSAEDQKVLSSITAIREAERHPFSWAQDGKPPEAVRRAGAEHMARSKKRGPTPPSKAFMLAVNEEQKAEWQAEAKRRGMTLTAWLREAIREALAEWSE